MSGKIDLTALQSESRNQNSTDIDIVSTAELCQIINDEDLTVADAVQPCLPTIAAAIDALANVVRVGGKVVYVGAGTSGRLGVLDASELPPTYSAEPEQFVALIAGGDRALRHAQEGAEDDVDQAVRDMQNVSLQTGDALIGIAASGRTPYVLSCLAYAKKLECITVGVACASPSAMALSGKVDFMIEAVTGAEIVTGSTRMKAGTATKMVLNMLSTGIQIRCGKTFGNMMVDVKATNLKLQQRARNILRETAIAARDRSDDDLDNLLREADGSVKLAIAMLQLNSPANETRQQLSEAGGVLRTLMSQSCISHRSTLHEDGSRKVVLCIDGGGSKCAAFVSTDKGEQGTAVGPACNVTTSTTEDATIIIKNVAEDAAQALPCFRGQNLNDIPFQAIWIGLAGFDRSQVAAKLGPPLERLFHKQSRTHMKITNDLELLATATGSGRHVCVLVAGTGSIAMVFRKTSKGYEKIGRAGGWGPLLGDEGSGFDIGRQAVRHILELYDGETEITDQNDTLPEAVLQHLGVESTQNVVLDVLSTLLVSSEEHKNDARQRIANVAKVLVEQQASSATAAKMVSDSICSMIRLLQRVVRLTTTVPAETTLVITGGLLQSELYREDLEKAIAAMDVRFLDVRVVEQPGLVGAQALLSPAR